MKQGKKMRIDKNIPMPTPRIKGAYLDLKFMDAMVVGDSFEIERSRFNTIRAYVSRKYPNNESGKKFTIRTYGDAYRCWRVE